MIHFRMNNIRFNSNLTACRNAQMFTFAVMNFKMIAQRFPDRMLIGFLVVMTVMNLLQANHTGALFDETYYWYFAKDLDWGYFDHPPMMAAFIKLGMVFLDGELGLRFFAPFLYAGTVFLIWKMLKHKQNEKNIILFCTITLSALLLNAYGFFMLPDTPLLFFSALFLYGYKRFLGNEDLLNAFIMAFAMAAMMYSKYHAALLILSVMIANPKLLKSKYFWLAGIMALIMYLPHIYWLYDSDFITLEYHLKGRTKPTFKISRPLNFVAGQFAIYGLVSFYFYWALIRTKTKDVFLRTCKYVAWIFLTAFFISSFNRNAQVQWTIVAVIPFIVMAYDFLRKNVGYQHWFYRLATINIVVLLVLRFALANEEMISLPYETFGNEEWVAELKERSNGLPVVFENSYRHASMYSFYTGIPTFSLNNLFYRKSQYDIDDSEASLQHKKVAFVSWFGMKDPDFSFVADYEHHDFKGRFIDDFRSARRLDCIIDKDLLDINDQESISFVLHNPYPEAIALDDLKFYGAYVHNNQRPSQTFIIEPSLKLASKDSILKANDSLVFDFELRELPKDENAKYFRVAISEYDLNIGFQGNAIPIKN